MPCTNAKLTELHRDSITVELDTKERFVLPFSRYGYFRYCTISELENVVCDGFSLEWPDAQIDFELDLLRHPEREGELVPLDKWLAYRANVRKQNVVREIASRAGRATSARKSAAARRNGALGGRPRKKKPVTT